MACNINKIIRYRHVLCISACQPPLLMYCDLCPVNKATTLLTKHKSIPKNVVCKNVVTEISSGVFGVYLLLCKLYACMIFTRLQ